MPSLTKTSFAAALSWSGIADLLGHWPREMPLILGYHRVVEDHAKDAQTLPGMTVSQGMLRAHLEWVARYFRLVSLDELGLLLESGVPCGSFAAVTFDDGYRDVHDYGLPVLQQMGVPAAVFVVSSLVGTHSPPLHDWLYQIVSEVMAGTRELPEPLAALLNGRDRATGPNAILDTVRGLLKEVPATDLRCILADLQAKGSLTVPPKQLDPIDWQALAAMHRAGVIVGSHTRTHTLLGRANLATVCEELQRSRREIETALGAPVYHFAYPDGSFSPRVVRAVAAAGYRFAYTICDHRDPGYPLLTLPRVMLWEGSCSDTFGRFSPSLLGCHATSLLPFRSRCLNDHGDDHGDSFRWASW